MSFFDDDIKALKVVVVGGGVGAAEAVLALHDLADAKLSVTMIAPSNELTLRPLAVADPFARGHAGSLTLSDFMTEHGGHFRKTAVLGVDPETHTVTCASGFDEHYDLLILAPGAARVNPFGHALVFGADPIALNGILADLEGGWSHSVAFVVPEGCAWPLPIYELALMTAEEVGSMNMDDVALHLVTPETAPLEIFGAEAAKAVADLLNTAGIELHTSVSARVPRSGTVLTAPGHELHVDRIVTLPLLQGPAIEGLPRDANGFLKVDASGLVQGVQDIYAIGDAADHAIKQGGLACQQADVAAADIARRAGATMDREMPAPVLRGRLLTGHHDRFLRRELGDAQGEAAEEPLWWPPQKVSGRYLSPYLEDKGLVKLPVRKRPEGHAVDVRVPLRWEQRASKEILGLDPLGSMRRGV